MATPRLIDFDAFRAEQEARPLIVRVGGKDYELSSSPPASVAFDGIRLLNDGKDKVPPEEVAKLAEDLFGKPMLDELVGLHRLSIVELVALIGKVMDIYSAEASPPPNRAARRAKKRPSRTT